MVRAGVDAAGTRAAGDGWAAFAASRLADADATGAAARARASADPFLTAFGERAEKKAAAKAKRAEASFYRKRGLMMGGGMYSAAGQKALAEARGVAKKATKAKAKAKTATKAATKAVAKAAKAAAKATTPAKVKTAKKAVAKAKAAVKKATKAKAKAKAVTKKAKAVVKKAAKAAAAPSWSLDGGPGRALPSGKSHARRKKAWFIRGRQKRAGKRSTKHLRTVGAIKAGHRVAGLVYRNPFQQMQSGGREMARQNPRRRRRRRNPMSMGGIAATAKRTIAAAIPAVAGGALISIIDAKLLADRSQAVRIGGKIVAAAAAGLLLRSRPDTANIMMGAMLGTLGYELAAKFSGGLMAPDKAAATQGLAALIREDPAAMGALVDATGAISSQPMYGLADVNLG